MPRLFTGVEIPREVADSLALLRGGLPGARWVDPENYHLTLRFIGDVDGLIAREGKGKAGCVARHLRHLREIIAERKGHNVVTSTINARPPAHGERRDKQG